MQGEADAECIPATKDLICRIMPNYLLERRKTLSSKWPTGFVRVFRIACTLETFITAFWVTFSTGVFEDSGEVDHFYICAKHLLFSCIVTFSYFIFVNLAWSVPITWHFSPCPKRVASTELLVFKYVNRFQKLHSKIFSACNYSAFFFHFSVFLMNLPLRSLQYCSETYFFPN